MLRPSMVVIAGPNGSGKTTLRRFVLEHEWLAGHTYVNADDIAEQELGGWNSLDAVRQAARIADERREACLAGGASFAYETVYSTSDRVAFLAKAKAAGYFVRFYFVGTSDPAINLRRVLARVAEGGHDVPTDKIEARYHRSIANLKRSLSIVDRAYIFDNTAEDQFPIRCVRTRAGQIAKVTDGPMPVWIEEAVTSPPDTSNTPA